MAQAKCGGGRRECEPLHQSQDVAEFGRFAANEAAARGHVVEQVTHLDARALRVRGGPDGPALAALDDELRAARGIGGARDHAHARDGAYRRQRLAAKPEGRDRLEVLEARDLAGRMAFERQRQFRLGETAAIVAHADQLESCAFDIDLDARGTRIERVLDQFLDHRRRPLDHLAGGDLIDERGRKNPDRHPGPRQQGSAAVYTPTPHATHGPVRPGREARVCCALPRPERRAGGCARTGCPREDCPGSSARCR